MQKRTIALLLTVLLSLSMFSLSAMAADQTISGTGTANSGTADFTGSDFAAGEYVVRVVNDAAGANPSVIRMFNVKVDDTGAISESDITVGMLAADSYKIYVNNMSGGLVAEGSLEVTPAAGETYSLTVTAGTGGSAWIGTTGSTTTYRYKQGEIVNITASANTYYSFNTWTTNNNSGSFENASNASTTFTMPGNDVTVTASFNYIGGSSSSSGGGGGGGGGGPTTPKDPDEDKDKDKPTTDKVTELRLSGYDQMDTAIAISKKGWPEKADAVVLAYAYSFPDALAAASLAYKENAPILLTDNQSVTASTLAEIQRLNPAKVILVGGTAVLSADLENSLRGTYEVTRYAGYDRYETATQIANAVGSTGKAVVVSGEVYHDAVVISSYAAKQGLPILFTERDTLPSSTSETLSRLGVSQTIVAGGTGVVSDSVYAQLPSPTRYAGYDCYETAAAIASAGELYMNLENVFVVTGINFPDALVAGNLAAYSSSPLIMVDGGTSLPKATENFFKTNKAKIKGFTVAGGTVVVPESQLNAIRNILNN